MKILMIDEVILIDSMEMRQNRAENLTNQMFDDGSFAQAFTV